MGHLLFLIFTNDSVGDLGYNAVMFADDIKLWRAIRSDADRQLHADLIQTYRIVGGRECTLDFDKVFELPGMDRLRGHPSKLQRKLVHTDIRQNAFSHRVIGVWTGLPDVVVLSDTVESLKRELEARLPRNHCAYNHDCACGGSLRLAHSYRELLNFHIC
ncbi:hypothetical protein SprV_0100290200 [Sparganum proliferum]